MNFEGIQTIAVVGLSDNPARASFRVAKYLQDSGFKIVPVNPTLETVLNEKAYPDLLAVPREIKIDLVDIFRKPEDVYPVVEQCVSRGDVKTVWMQEGIVNDAAAKLAEKSGLAVVMDKCLMIEHQNME